MKSLLILILLVALGAAAFFTRPTKDDFERYVVAESTKGDTNVFSAGWDKMQSENFVNSLTFKNHLLWVDVQQNGQTVYTGAFSHWFNRATVQADLNTAKQTAGSVANTVGQGIDAIKSNH
jgi:hypothetical protein